MIHATLNVGSDTPFAPVDADVATTVRAAAEALANLGVTVEPVRIPILEEINALSCSGTSR